MPCTLKNIPDRRSAYPVGKEDNFVRELGSIERLMHLYSSQHPRHFCVAAEIAGTIDQEACLMAFGAVQKRHPMLSVHVKSRGASGPAVYKSNAAIKVVIAPAESAPDWSRSSNVNWPSPSATTRDR